MGMKSRKHKSEDIKLIQTVRVRPVLYQKNTTPKDRAAAWQEVAEEMKWPAKECDRRFKNIRDTYYKACKAGKGKMYKYWTEVKFLDRDRPGLVSSHGGTNFCYAQDYQDDNEDVDFKTEVDTLNVDEEMSEDDYNDEDDNSQATKVTAWTQPVSDSLETKKKNQNRDKIKKTTEVPPTLVIQSGDPLQMYFSSIYSTVRNFQPRQIAILQKKIFDLVHEATLEDM